MTFICRQVGLLALTEGICGLGCPLRTSLLEFWVECLLASGLFVRIHRIFEFSLNCLGILLEFVPTNDTPSIKF